jgi:hypothetical protein
LYKKTKFFGINANSQINASSPVLFLNAWLADINIETDKAGHTAKVFKLAFVFSTIGCIVKSGILVVGEGILAGV